MSDGAPSSAPAMTPDDVRTALALGLELDGEAHRGELVGDQQRDALFPRRGVFRVERIFRLGLSGRNQLAGQVEPRLLGDAAHHLLLDGTQAAFLRRFQNRHSTISLQIV